MTNQGFYTFSAVRFFLGAFCFIVSLMSCGCDRHISIIEELTQKDAILALVLLVDHDILAIKEAHSAKRGTSYHIKVKESQATEALRLLTENHIPSTDRASLKEVYPPGSSGIIPSKSDEVARLIMAMQGESEALLKVIPGIVDVRVVFSLEPPSDFKLNSAKKTASVALVYQPQGSILDPPLTNHEIQTLIASSFSNLLPEDVTVVQKMLNAHKVKPKVAMGMHKAAISLPDKNEQPKLQWWLMVLTAVALLVASYGVFRLIHLRRV